MSRSKSHVQVSHVYTPDSQTSEELIANFVIRKREFKKILKSITNTALEEPPQHFLIEGQRGAGKTSLMLRLRYELEVLDESHLIPIQFPEEQYGVFDLCGVWELVAEYLQGYDGFEGLIATLDEHAQEEDYELTCFEWLNDYLDINSKRLVLFLDNFGDLLNRFGPIEHKRLRDIFHSTNNVQLVAASAQTLEYTYKYEEPFYEFFKTIRLEGLNREQVLQLLRQLAIQHNAKDEIEVVIREDKGRIDTILSLTGDVPRTVVLLFEIFLDQNGDVFEDLEALLDRVTPLYKHRMDDLPRQQQAIVNTVALNWDGIKTSEIVSGLKSRGFDNRKVSAQLKVLEENNVVTSRLLDKKNKIYFLKERFFNIWYLMRLGKRNNAQRVKWLVCFFKAWYTPDELKRRAELQIERVQAGTLKEKAAYHYAEALVQLIEDAPNIQDEIIKRTRAFLSKTNSGLATALSDSNIELLQKAHKAFYSENYDKALYTLAKMSSKDEYVMALIPGCKFMRGSEEEGLSELLDLSKAGNESAMYNLGHLYQNEHKDLEKAEEYYKQAADLGHMSAMYNLGLLYQNEHKDLEKAEEHYKQAADLGDTGAMYNLGHLYKNEHKDLEKAEEYYKQAADLGHMDAMYNLGHLYQNEHKDLEKAEEYYKQAADLDHMSAMYTLGLLYQNEHKDLEKAEEYYKQAADLGHMSAMYNLGLLYKNEHKDLEKAEEYYKQAADLGDMDAMYNLGHLYQNEHKDLEKAEECYKQAADLGHMDAMYNLGLLYQNEHKDLEKAEEYYKQAADLGHMSAMYNLGHLYQNEHKDLEKAEEYYKQAADLGDMSAMNNLAYLYQNEHKDLEKAEEYYKQAADLGHMSAMYNLGHLYKNEHKNLEKAEEYYKQAADLGHMSAMNNLAYLYYEKNDLDLSQQALGLINIAIERESDAVYLATKASLLLWINEFNESDTVLRDLIAKEEYSAILTDLTDHFIFLIAKKQRHALYQLFSDFPQLKEELKPVYYALVKLMHKEYPKEYLKMPPEIEDTVEQILVKVQEQRAKYAIS